MLTGVAAKLFFGGCCAVQWWAAILLGSILSATDPVRPSPQAACLLTTFLLSCHTWLRLLLLVQVAVVAVLGTLGAPSHLRHMIEGEVSSPPDRFKRLLEKRRSRERSPGSGPDANRPLGLSRS